jgi:hypothetical protein
MKLNKVLFGLFAVLGFVVMFGLVGSVDSHAKSAQNTFSCLGKKFGQFEVLAVKKNEWSQDDTVCGNNGNRVFFPLTTSGNIGSINWTFNPDTKGSLDITDCDGTTDRKVDVDVDFPLHTPYWVVVALVGPPNEGLTLYCDDDLLNEDICAIDMVALTTGGSWTKIVADLLADDQEFVTWTLDCTAGKTCARHMKVQVFEADQCL